MDTFDMLGHWRGGANQDAADEALRTGKPVKLGFLERAFGGTIEDAQNIVKTTKQKALNDALGKRAAAAGMQTYAGGSFADYGQTEGSLIQQITAAEKKQVDAKETKLRGYKKDDNKMLLDNQLAVGRQTIDANAAQFGAQLKSEENRYAHTSKESALQRQHESERGDKRDALSLQMQVMQNDLSEKRMDYDRETRRMDKRTAMIAQLMSGLGSLGGAFSL